MKTYLLAVKTKISFSFLQVFRDADDKTILVRSCLFSYSTPLVITVINVASTVGYFDTFSTPVASAKGKCSEHFCVTLSTLEQITVVDLSNLTTILLSSALLFFGEKVKFLNKSESCFFLCTVLTAKIKLCAYFLQKFSQWTQHTELTTSVGFINILSTLDFCFLLASCCLRISFSLLLFL